MSIKQYDIYCPRCGEDQQRTIRLLVDFLSQREPHAATTWYFSVSPTPLAVNPITEADALVSNMFERLSETVGVSGREGRANTFEGTPLKSIAVSWLTGSDRLTSKFSLVYYEDGLYGFVSAAGGSPDAQVQPWLDAVDFALAKQAKGVPLHEWSAAIGIRSGGMRTTLAAAAVNVGPLMLQPRDFVYQEAVTGTSLHSHQIRYWTPVIVRGRSRGHSWQAAQLDAHEQLHLLCSLLSAESDVHWGLRETARPAEWGELTLPEKTLSLEKCADDAPGVGNSLALDGERLTRMWDKCKADGRVIVPAATYYEALALSEHHPSFALVGFVSAIEEIGKLLVEAEKPDACPTCNKPKFNGARRRFSNALALVLPADKVKAVSERLYRWRSSTVHAGHTFDWEKSFGQSKFGDSMLITAPQSLFRVQGQSHAQEIARKLLLYLLT